MRIAHFSPLPATTRCYTQLSLSLRAHTSILFGTGWSESSSPWPRQPFPPYPHAQVAPSAVVARLCASPAARATTKEEAGKKLTLSGLELQ